ncbi:hypothetical protein [Rhodoferax sp. GW822-FHT02A01]|uniref:MurR/RpiR family transcriptional regulator n=1 Tax=Rhodoferax sp. GW822-FHT02A01 TaxID=3141537 RepID=UPI00315C7094
MKSQTATDAQRDVIHHLDRVWHSLSTCEAKVARIYLQNASDLAHMTVKEVSRMAHVSPPTVLRFCRRIGYSGFADFKNKLLTVPEEQHSQTPIAQAPQTVP